MQQLHLVLQAYRVENPNDDLSFATIPLTTDSIPWLTQLPTAYAAAKANMRPSQQPLHPTPARSYELDAISVALPTAQFWTYDAHTLDAITFRIHETNPWSLRWLNTDAMVATASAEDDDTITCHLEMPHLAYDWSGDIYLRGYTQDENAYVLSNEVPLAAVLAAYQQMQTAPADAWFQADQIHLPKEIAP